MVESGGLENRYSPLTVNRGFESPPLRIGSLQNFQAIEWWPFLFKVDRVRKVGLTVQPSNRQANQRFWRGVRVAEGARLESVYRRKSIAGSNPALSASEF